MGTSPRCSAPDGSVNGMVLPLSMVGVNCARLHDRTPPSAATRVNRSRYMRSSRGRCARNVSLIAPSRFDANDQDAIAIDAGILTVQLLQAAHEQSRADEQHQRQRDLRHAENLARPQAAANGTADSLQRGREVDPRGPQRRASGRTECRSTRETAAVNASMR